MVEHLNTTQFLGILMVMLVVAKVGGWLAHRVGQPAVLGELIGGLLVGRTTVGWVDPDVETIRLVAELGIVILLFAIGLETDVGSLVKVGATSATVAFAGVALPFVLGYAACRLLGLGEQVSIMSAATLTATSVGITARVLSDLGRVHDPEGRIILGAAVIDDVLGLLILTVVAGMAEGCEVSGYAVTRKTLSTLGFLVAALALGRLLVPPLFRWSRRIDLPGTPTIMAVIAALGMAWLAEKCGSQMIIGAFAAGILVAKVPQIRDVEHSITELGHVFVPLFFVAVGASVQLQALNPLESASRASLVIGGALIIAGIAGKLASGFAPVWFRGNKLMIGMGMVPRGEVGLIFAQAGLSSGVFDAGLFGAVTLMVIVTTLLAPPALRLLLGPLNAAPDRHAEGIESLVTDA
jgi:Kef-type K+ transport system membrane component KefB